MESNNVQQLSSSNFPVGPANAIEHVATETQAPFGIACTSALSAMSNACQGNIDVDYHGPKPTSLNTIVIASSGERKSKVDSMFSHSTIDMDAKFEMDFHNKVTDYNNQLDAWKIENEFLKKKYLDELKGNGNFIDELKGKFIDSNNLKPKYPKKYKIIHENVTIEAIQETLSNGSVSALLTSNEGGTVTKGALFNYSAILNKVWDNQPIRIDRKSVPSFTINNARLSIALMIQLGMFEKLMDKHGDELRDSGFFARCLICQPQSTQGWRMKQNDEHLNEFKRINSDEFDKFHERTRHLLKRAYDRYNNNEAKELMRFTPEAQRMLYEQYNWAEMQLRANGLFYDIKDFGSRYMEHISRVAAILQYFTTDQLFIEESTLILAIDIVNYYTKEFIRIFTRDPGVPDVVKNSETLYRWLCEKASCHPRYGIIKKNDIRKIGPSCIRNKMKLDEAINMLLMQGRIYCFPIGYGTKATTYIQIINQFSLI